MKVFHSPQHALHAPRYEFARGRAMPYEEVPHRAESILRALGAIGLCARTPPALDAGLLLQVHTADYLEFLRAARSEWEAQDDPSRPAIPATFAIRAVSSLPKVARGKAGWFCLDTGTPILRGTWQAALGSAACAAAAAEALIAGETCAYALCRPPGHHAGPDFYGGYCYLNNAALCARLLSDAFGRAAVIDLDFHHGNGTQAAFWTDPRVFYASIHADPSECYPYFWGYAHERGAGKATGTNLNLPLPLGSGPHAYMDALGRALEAVRSFAPQALVVSLGTDTAAGEEDGGFGLELEHFGRLGRAVAQLGLPTAVVQEGGYALEVLGVAVAAFLEAFTGR